MKITKNLGDLFLAIFLILTGLAYFVSFELLGLLIALAALVAGVLKLIGK
ncbi:MAG: hypothetical protein P8046_11575 [Anaerolineales bacterium]